MRSGNFRQRLSFALRGDRRTSRSGSAGAGVVAMVLTSALACGGPADGGERFGDAATPSDDSGARAVVAPGVEVLLRDSLHLVQDRRVGLITNQTGIDATGRSTIDRLHDHPRVALVALFSPEHGIRGQVEAGVLVDSGTDSATGLPVHSLYGDTRKPSGDMLEGLDVLVFDIQDVGARYYTYVYTMALAMDAAAEAGVPFVVLDRPNPIGGAAVQGGVLDPAFASFVGMYPVPMRHGMTPGELARLFSRAFGAGDPPTVVPLDGWTRSMSFTETGLRWVAPSPNMPSVESALHYPGTCLFEGTNLSVGRGTDRAFQQIGAPWLDADALVEALRGHELEDVAFESVRFTPSDPGDGKFPGEEVRGVRFTATGPDYDPTLAAVAALVESRRLAGERWEWRPAHFDRLAGTAALRRGIDAGRDVSALTAEWAGQLARFRVLRQEALLYP